MLRLHLLLSYFNSYIADALIQSLESASGALWSLSNANLSIRTSATVPGVVHLDLLKAGIIEEPYAELNVDAQAWVKQEPFWEWRCVFTASPLILESSFVDLIAEGIDSRADVSLNGAQLWSQDDAFVRTVYDVGKNLRRGENSLVVRVFSSTLAAAAANASCSGFCPSALWGPPSNYSSYDRGINYLRTPGVNFGWDFAPNFAPTGVWRGIFLRGYAAAALEDVAVVTTPNVSVVPRYAPTAWNVSVTAYIAVRKSCHVNVTLAILGLTRVLSAALSPSPGKAASGVTVTLDVGEVDAWWPRGYGAATLYNATLTLHSDAAADSQTQSFSVGFRQVSLQQPPARNGSLYFFTVNGHAIFVKGANWVPADAFAPRAAQHAQLSPKIASFAAAGYNSLRVWGGGYAQPDVFYSLAQEAGILVWHEMPYACVGYPTGGNALLNAAREAGDITLRLQKFSILMWGGNNEVAQLQNYSPGSVGAGNYSALFFGSIGEAVAAVDTSRRYVPTSPGSGSENASAPIASPAQSPDRGDMHFYSYKSDCLDPSQYPPLRAASEFGWQSYPSFISLAELMGPESFDFWSPAVQRRDTHEGQPPAVILFHNVGQNWRIPGYNGSAATVPGERDARLAGAAAAAAQAARSANATSQSYTRRRDGTFTLPTDALGIVPMMGSDPTMGAIFRDTLFLTQISHAACLKTEAEAYRRQQSSCARGQGHGCTSTILFWMASDLWPAATKGSVEWSGRWKATAYEAANRFLAPLLLSPWSWRVNSSMPATQARMGVTLSAQPLHGTIPDGLLRLSCWSWALGHVGDAFHSVNISTWPSAWGDAESTGAAGGAVDLLPDSTNIADALASCGCTDTAAVVECAITVDIFNSSSRKNLGASLAHNWLLPAPMNQVETMRKPNLKIIDVLPMGSPYHHESPGAFIITITASALPVANVWLESLLCCGFFSDNNFFMSESPKVLLYTPSPDARGWAHAPPAGQEKNMTAGQLAASLSIWSLWDTVVGY